MTRCNGFYFCGVAVCLLFVSGCKNTEPGSETRREVFSGAPCLSGLDKRLHNSAVVSSEEIVWTQNCLGQGGTCWYLTIHPDDSNRVLESTDGGATYLTTDGSRTYQSVNDCDRKYPRMADVKDCKFWRRDGRIGYAATERNGLFKTVDGGRTWNPLGSDGLPLDDFWAKKPFQQYYSCLAIDPDDADTILVGLGSRYRDFNAGSEGGDATPRYANGIILSKDGGRTWRHITDAMAKEAMALAMHITPRNGPQGKVILVASSHGFYVSRDEGKTWQKKPPEDYRIAGPGNPSWKIQKTLPHDRCRDMDVHYSKSGRVTVFVTLETQVRETSDAYEFAGGVFRSADLGETWDDVTGNLHLPTAWILQNDEEKLVSHVRIKLIYQKCFADPERRRAMSTEVYKADDGRYKQALDELNRFRGTVVKGEEAARRVKNSPTVLQDFKDVRVDPRDENTIYVADAGCVGKTFPPYGVWKTTNGGKTWINTVRAAKGWRNAPWSDSKYASDPLLNIQQTYTAENPMNSGEPDPRWGYLIGPFGMWDVRTFDIARFNPDVLYFHTHRVVYRSDDAGKTWRDVTNRRVGQGWIGRGNSNINPYGLAFHPRIPGRMLFMQMDEGLWRSDDGGKSLYKLGAFGANHYVSAAQMDPDDPRIVYHMNHIQGGCFLKSADGGRTFEGVNAAADGRVTVPESQRFFPGSGGLTLSQFCLLVDPDSPRENRRIYVGMAAKDGPSAGIRVSEDGGDTWRPCNNGLPGENLNVFRVVMDPHDGRRLYAALLSGDKQSAGGLYVATDKGQHWRRITSLPLNHVTWVEIDSSNPGTIYACGAESAGLREGGLYKSSDAGRNWEKIFNAPRITCVAVSPFNPDLVYCASTWNIFSGAAENPGIYRSVDGGKTWSRANRGLATLNARSIVFNPHVEGEVWCVSETSGFYRTQDNEHVRKVRRAGRLPKG